ncbi:MAG: IS66 family transposase [Phycisphaerae bacterium]|nr:IS66 family transposase [Phycisphaerae bacterium]
MAFLSRSRDGPSEFLKDYRGTLVADGYGGYDGVVTGNGIVRAGCWAHARRKFVDAERSEPDVAKQAVALINAMFAVERRAKDLDPAARLEMRQRESSPLLVALRARLDRWRTELLPKHQTSKAVGYALNQWEELTVFAADGAVPIDNNGSEREMKRMALNRENSLFVGNPRGGETAAIPSSLTSSCRRHAVDPQRYLTQLLVNLPAATNADLE